jgi:hypothetical protein
VWGQRDHRRALDQRRDGGARPDHRTRGQAAPEPGRRDHRPARRGAQDGFAFSPSKSTEQVFPASKFRRSDIRAYVHAHLEELRQPGANLGLWAEKDKVYMDVPRVV